MTLSILFFLPQASYAGDVLFVCSYPNGVNLGDWNTSFPDSDQTSFNNAVIACHGTGGSGHLESIFQR